MHIDIPCQRKFQVSWILLPLILVAAQASDALAQVNPNDDGVNRKGVTIKRIKPADLPQPEESEIPLVLQGKAPLPRAPSLTEMANTRDIVMPQVFQIVAIYKTKSALHQYETLLRGNAVWLSANEKGADPILVTPFHWLEKATEVYVVPWDKHQVASRKENLPRAEVRQLSGAVQQNIVKKFFRTSKQRVRLQIKDPDEHRNLVTLVVDEEALKAETRKGRSNRHKRVTSDWFKPPQSGLSFFDVSKHSAMRIFGQSPLLAPIPRQTIITSTAEEELVYYLQCDFPVALGAPLFTLEGGVIGMTALKHPKKPGISLVIPPRALETYVRKGQGLRKVELVEDVKDGESK